MTDAPEPAPPVHHPNLRLKRALTPEETAARRLTAKERLFVAEYMSDLNATRAADRAGYSGAGTAWRLVRRPAVAAAMREAMAARAERAELTADMVLAEVTAVAFTSLADIAEWGSGPDGQPRLELKESLDLPPSVRRGLGEIRFAGGGVGINTRAKVAALGLLMRHMGLLGPQAGSVAQGRKRDEPPTPDEQKAAGKLGPNWREEWLRLGTLDFATQDQRDRMRALFAEMGAAAEARGYDQLGTPESRKAVFWQPRP